MPHNFWILLLIPAIIGAELAFGRSMRKSEPCELTDDGGTIVRSKIPMLIFFVCFTVWSVAVLAAAVSSYISWWLVLATWILSVPFAYLSWKATRDPHAIVWDKAGIEGPAPWYWNTKRRRISWSQIFQVANTADGIAITTPEGPAFFIDQTYPGSGYLLTAIELHRPDITIKGRGWY